MTPVCEMFWTVILAFIYCELGQRMSSGFFDAFIVIYQSEWHSFPLKIQRILPNIMFIVQQPITLHGFVNTSCTRNTYKKVSSIHLNVFK